MEVQQTEAIAKSLADTVEGLIDASELLGRALNEPVDLPLEHEPILALLGETPGATGLDGEHRQLGALTR
jgi:hypothetical protein